MALYLLKIRAAKSGRTATFLLGRSLVSGIEVSFLGFVQAMLRGQRDSYAAAGGAAFYVAALVKPRSGDRTEPSQIEASVLSRAAVSLPDSLVAFPGVERRAPSTSFYPCRAA